MGLPGCFRLLSTHDYQIYVIQLYKTDRRLCLVLQTRLNLLPPNLPDTGYQLSGAIPVR